MKWLLLFVALVALVGVVSADTLIVYTTNATDGRLYALADNATFTTLRDASTGVVDVTESNDGARVISGAMTDRYKYMYRSFLVFDTSVLPDDATISASQISLYKNIVETGLGDTGIGITKFYIDGTYTADDYNNFGSDRFSTDKLLSTMGTAKYYNWSFNPLGIENISLTGNSPFFVRTAWDIDNTSPSWVSATSSSLRFRHANYVSFPPFLEITYTVPDTTPPASITGLTNTSVSCNQLFFNWTNPTDADYAGLMVWQNNTQLANLSSADTGVPWGGLPGGTAITFSSRTFDSSGNVNATWVNITATTSACAPVAPAADYDWDWCAKQDIFFRNDSSDIPGYFVADHRPQIETTKYKSVSVSSGTGEKTLGSWATITGSPGVTNIGPGLWRFRVYLNVSSASGNTSFLFKIFNRSSTGVETDLFYGHVIGADVGDLTTTEHLISYARRNYTTMFPGDRLVIKVNASTSSVAARDAYMAVAGNSYASMVESGYYICDGGSGGSGVMVSNELPLPFYIPLIAAGLSILAWRRKSRM